VANIPQAKGGERQTIIVVGAGIGGLTAALALAAASFRIIVVERSDHLSEAGAGIQIAPNAGRVLASLGLAEKVSAVAIEPEAIDVRSGVNGKVLASIPGPSYRARYGEPYRVIHRADLQAVLAAAVDANPNVTLELGATVAQTLPQPDGLLVRIQRPGGIDVVPAVAIVAADGVWSTFREKINSGAKPQPTGRTAWRALIPADVARDLVSMARINLWLGRNAHLVHYPVAQGSAVNVVAIVDEVWDRPGWSAVGDRAEIARRFRAWPLRARHLIAAPVSWQKFAINRVAANAPWTSDRLVLLGDAAHAMEPYLAQGAAMAIEDAAVLAGHLRGATDVPAALRAYEAARKPRVAAVASAAARTGRQYHFAGPLAFARDTALHFAAERLILERNDWIYNWRVSAG
jgi:salicylate hydroxylase